MAFGSYSPEKAEQAKIVLDSDLGLIENRANHIKGVVPNTGALDDRLDQALEIFREVVGDYCAEIDQRTDTEAVAKW